MSFILQSQSEIEICLNAISLPEFNDFDDLFRLNTQLDTRFEDYRYTQLSESDYLTGN